MGQAYVDIPEQTVFLVDVAFSKTKEYRSWYYTPLEYHNQVLAGSVDAIASSLDTLNDFHLAEVVPIAKLYQVLGLSKYFSPNSSGGSKFMPAKTQNGELIRSASAFITGFYLLDLAGFSYIKPVSILGQYGRGVAAFGIVNAAVTPIMQKRVADLLSKDVGLKSVVLDYLSVHPDDSNAEARFKNGLEGLALGAVFEPLFIVFRIIKNTLTRTLITRVPTRRTYKLETEQVEVVNDTGKEVNNQIIKNKDGLNEITINKTPLDAHSRLNTKDLGGNGKSKAAEAATAAQLESILGPMERYNPPLGTTSQSSPDFVIISGPNKGKTVDAMYTTDDLLQKEIDGINKFYEKNMNYGNGKDTIQDHLKKADFVPIDFRVLNPDNQKIFIDYIKTLPKSQQDKIIIMR